MAYNYSYNTLIDRFKAFADGHYLIRKFTHGQIDLADLDLDGEYPYMHVAPGNITPVQGAMQFGFEVLFMDLPRDKETKAEYQRESLSDCIRLAQDLITEIAVGRTLFGVESGLATQPTIQPLIEEYKHTLTGVQLSISIELPYDWSACDIPADYSVGGSGSGGTGVALGITFKVNGVNNAIQNVLDLVEGTGINITDNGDGSVTISNTGGGGGSVSWGDIVGTLTNQTDLQNALNDKADTASLAAVATSGDYDDLLNTPTIPAAQVNSDWNAVSGVEQILNKPTIPAAQIQSDWTQTDNTQLDYIKNKPSLPATVGDMLKSVYDTDDDGTVDAAETVQIIVRNSTGSTLTKGQIVYLSGATGNRPNAVLADATDEITSSKTIGMVVANITNNSDGYVAVNGTLHDLDTSAFTAGDTLWLSETAGAMQANTPPSEPAHSVFIGYVARSHPNLGRVVLAIQNGYELNELHGVLVPSPSANDVLYYDGATSLWKNKQLSKSDVGLSNVDNTSDANKPVSSAQQTAIDAKVTANAAITGATKTKITYDSKGLVTAGADITASDLPSGIDAAKIGSGTVSNTEFGYLDGVTSAIQTQLNGTQEKLVSGTNIKTVNSTSLLGSGNVAVAAQDSISLINNVAVTIGASTTSYISFCAFTTNSAETSRQIIVPISGTIRSLYVLTSSTQSANNSQVCTVRKNGANTSVTTTIAANAAAGTFSDTTNTVSVAAGDKLSLQVQNNAASGTAAQIVSVAIIIERS
jgi:hypothetical protein